MAMDWKTLERALEKTLERLDDKGYSQKNSSQLRAAADCLLNAATREGNRPLQKALETTLQRLEERARKDDLTDTKF